MIKVYRLDKDNLRGFEKFVVNIPLKSDSILIGASVSDVPGGFLLAEKDEEDPDTYKVKILFVDFSFRRMGVATKLFDEFLKEIEKVGYKELYFDAVAHEEQMKNIYSFLKNYGFNNLEIVVDVYEINCKDLCNNKRFSKIVKSKNINPAGIEIVPLNEVNVKLINDLKERVNIDYPKLYTLFPKKDRFKMSHYNTFVAIADSKEIVGWLTGLIGSNRFIYYETIFVKKGYRDLALGVWLINQSVKSHVNKYSNKTAAFCVSRENPTAQKFFSMYFKNVKKDLKYNFIIKKLG